MAANGAMSSDRPVQKKRALSTMHRATSATWSSLVTTAPPSPAVMFL